MNLKFAHSRFGARLFLIFAGCVILPLIAFTLYSYFEVSEQLYAQAEKRLRKTSKNAGMHLFEYLMRQEESLRKLAVSSQNQNNAIMVSAQGLSEDFAAITLHEPGKSPIPFAGSATEAPEFSLDALKHLQEGSPHLLVIGENSQKRLMLAVPLEGGRMLLGVIRTERLSAQLQQTLSFPSQIHLLMSNHSLLGDLSHRENFQERLREKIRLSSSGIFKWQDGGEAYHAGYWSIFMRAHFQTEDLIVVVREEQDQILQPASRFSRSFFLVFLSTSLVILLAGSILVRRSVAPLKALEEGTRQLNLDRFDYRVQIDSGDEFQGLATSFNKMAERLSSQFATQKKLNQFVRAILSALDRDEVVRLVLKHLPDIIGCRCTSLGLFETNALIEMDLYRQMCGESEKEPRPEQIVFTGSEYSSLRAIHDWQLVESAEDFPIEVNSNCGSMMLFPMTVKGRLYGILFLGFEETPTDFGSKALRGRQVADQIATSLSNAALMKDLEDLNWGTLTTLARTVDAKSPWTAGHSERVTALSLHIGHFLGLSPGELERLKRAALLHDIGKIAVPEEVLDKPGKLTKEEFALIKEHPQKGAQILEPIRAYREIVPIIEEHHEWFNGLGYPHGLSGERISLSGKILALADVYDALISDRPYRPGMPLERVLGIIKEGSGHQFDPKVVDTFLKIIDKSENTLPPAVNFRASDKGDYWNNHIPGV